MQIQLAATKVHGNQMRTGGSAMIERAVAARSADTTLEFGRFCVVPRQRGLLADGVPVELGARAFDILLVLIEAGGHLVCKDELLSRVWSGVVVEENNLHWQISMLRRAFGNERDLIQTVARRGYRFTATVRSSPSAAASGGFQGLAKSAECTELSHRLSELSKQLAELTGQLGCVLDLLGADQIAEIVRSDIGNDVRMRTTGRG